MSKVTKSTNAPVSVTPKETSVSKQESNLPNIDPALATLMGVAAVVSGVMSYRGAIEIFNSELMGLGFTIVVQGIVTIVLWYLALATTTQRIILMFVWAVAVTFSIGTAFITTDKANDGRDVDVAINQLATYEASIAAKNTEMKQQMAHKDREAEAEEKGLRGSPPGCGTICESLKQESRALASRVDVFETDVLPALKKAQKAREGLSQTASLADVDAIFKDLKLSTQAFAKDVPEPSFVGKTTKGVFDRLGDAVDTVTQGSAGDATSITSALWVASLMEILALGCAIIRYCARLRLDIGALFNDFESLLAFAYNLKGLPQRVSTLALRKETEWQDAFQQGKGGACQVQHWERGEDTNARPVEERPGVLAGRAVRAVGNLGDPDGPANPRTAGRHLQCEGR